MSCGREGRKQPWFGWLTNTPTAPPALARGAVAFAARQAALPVLLLLLLSGAAPGCAADDVPWSPPVPAVCAP
jgi:hypothetical protein